jgi:hypothetical protein
MGLIFDICILLIGLAAFFTSNKKLKEKYPGDTKADRIARKQYRKYTYIGVVLYFTLRVTTYFLL